MSLYSSTTHLIIIYTCKLVCAIFMDIIIYVITLNRVVRECVVNEFIKFM